MIVGEATIEAVDDGDLIVLVGEEWKDLRGWRSNDDGKEDVLEALDVLDRNLRLLDFCLSGVDLNIGVDGCEGSNLGVGMNRGSRV